MVKEDRFQNALLAMNTVLVIARAMAYERREHEELAKVLDVAEYITLLIVGSDDATDHFRDMLVGLREVDDRFNLAVEKFDQT